MTPKQLFYYIYQVSGLRQSAEVLQSTERQYPFGGLSEDAFTEVQANSLIHLVCGMTKFWVIYGVFKDFDSTLIKVANGRR